MIPNQANQSNTTDWLERLDQIQANVADRLLSDANTCLANSSLDDLIDLVRALAERVAVLEQETANHHHVVSAAIRRHRDTAHLP